MSSKSDRDNRSNQLNPNNSAYHSSRGHGSGDDDGETIARRLTGAEALEQALARIAWEFRVKEQNRPIESTFRAAFVALTGPVKVIEFSLASTSFFGGKAGNEDLAEILVEEIGRQLSIKWKSSLALRALRDEEGTDFFWAGFEYPRGQINGSNRAESERLWSEYGKETVAKVRAFMAAPFSNAYRIEQWGRIERHPSLALTRLSPDFYRQITELIQLNERRAELP